jgi:predicted HNH restriction endonuclease
MLFKKDNIDVNHISNLQALCPNCHAVKTKRFMKQKKIFTSEEIDFGSGPI